jgi:hypothetical protein
VESVLDENPEVRTIPPSGPGTRPDSVAACSMSRNEIRVGTRVRRSSRVAMRMSGSGEP